MRSRITAESGTPNAALRARVRAKRAACGLLAALLALGCFGAPPPAGGNPLSQVSETFIAWKARLFGRKAPPAHSAPARGPVPLVLMQAERIRIDQEAPERDFPAGRSRYRLVELESELAHAAVRVQVVAQKNREARGNTVFKPLLYVLDEAGVAGAAVEVKPLHIDIRPFRRTRLLGCVTLENVRRFALATSPAALGKFYVSEARGKVQAPTQGGFHYAAEPLKVFLPWVATGELIIEAIAAERAGEGC